MFPNLGIFFWNSRYDCGEPLNARDARGANRGARAKSPLRRQPRPGAF